MSFKVHRYPHNDLGNLAHYHLETINRKIATKELEGVGLDCMSFLIALAFHVEALLNFIGSSKAEQWKERVNYKQKLDKVLEVIQLSEEDAGVPKEILEILKSVRDGLAHGKPADYVAQATSRVELRTAMQAPWEKYLTPEFCNDAYEQINKFKLLAFERAGVKIGATLTSAFGGW